MLRLPIISGSSIMFSALPILLSCIRLSTVTNGANTRLDIKKFSGIIKDWTP